MIGAAKYKVDFSRYKTGRKAVIRALEDHLLQQGFKWSNGKAEPSSINYKYLFIDGKSKLMAFGISQWQFENSRSKELKPHQITSIKPKHKLRRKPQLA